MENKHLFEFTRNEFSIRFVSSKIDELRFFYICAQAYLMLHEEI